MSFIIKREISGREVDFISGRFIGSRYLGLWNWTTVEDKALNFEISQEAEKVINECKELNRCGFDSVCTECLSSCSIVEITQKDYLP